MRHKAILALFLLFAPLGWALFWVVFRSVPGQDWVVFHTAAILARAQDYATLMDPRAFTNALNRLHEGPYFKPITILHPWVYPPVTLLVALPFAFLPYFASLAVFLGITLALLLAALWPWAANARQRGWLFFLVLVCPAVAFQLGAGQLTFLVAACVMAGMWLLDTRPFLAGLVLSVLSVKPQYALLIPVAVLAGRHWRAAAGGVAGGLALVAASLALFGTDAWWRWLLLASGEDPTLARVIPVTRAYDQGVHTCLRVLGFSEGVAGAGTVLALLAGAVCVAVAFAGRWEARRRTEILLLAMVAASPHVGNYDEILVAIAVVLMLLDGLPRPAAELSLGAGAWLATLFNPPALFAVLKVPVITAFSALTGFLPLALVVFETVRGREVRQPTEKESFVLF